MRSIGDLRAALTHVADPDRAAAARRYMRDQFDFLGIAMPELRRTARPFITEHRRDPAADLLDLVDELWDEPEREFQYVGVDLLRAGVRELEGGHLIRIERFIRTLSWWDTVDAIASNVVGAIVAADRAALAPRMDEWIDDADFWIARTAILHQLRYGAETDADQLFDHVDRRCGDAEFFIRKACGWALRQYARHDPEAVRLYVDSRGDRLSRLTRREATKHL